MEGSNMVSLNNLAHAAIEPLLSSPGTYRVVVSRMGNGATLVDCGIDTPGSYGAGILFAGACMAGMAQVSITSAGFGDMLLPSVNVSVDRPVEACMASQYAGWAIKKDSYFAMGSGPARALWRGEELFERIRHVEKSDVAVILLETRDVPPDEVVATICEKTGVRPGGLTILAAPTASVTGSIQVSARIVETAIHKMLEVGFDLDSILAGSGTAPIAPVAGDDMTAIGRTNDCVLYGGVAHITVDCDDEFLLKKVYEIPSSSSSDYGRTFLELFKKYGDFYKIDPSLFSPAVVTVNNVRSGRMLRAGSINHDVLETSFSMD